MEEPTSQGKGCNTSKAGETSTVEANLREPRSETEDGKNKLSENISNETQVKADIDVKSSDKTDVESLIQKIEDIGLEESTSQENGGKDTDPRNDPENKDRLGSINSEGGQVKSCGDVKSTEDGIKGNMTENPSHSLYELLMPVYQVSLIIYFIWLLYYYF